jgi:hypothetical protein
MAAVLLDASANPGIAAWDAPGNANLDAMTFLADPGTAAAIPVTASVAIPLVIGAGAETNTLAVPSFISQTLMLYVATIGAGTRAVTVASAINQAGNTIITLNSAADWILLRAIGTTNSATPTLAWRVVTNDGCALS